MRILYLTNKPIFPLLDGGCVAMNQTAKLLMDEQFSADYLTIATHKHPFLSENFPSVFTSKFNPKSIFVDTKLKVGGLLKSFFTGKSYHISRFYSKQFEDALIEKITTNDYDVILCESLYLLPYIEIIRNNFQGKVILRTHNVEHLIWARVAENASFFKRKLLSILTRQLKKEEVSLLQKVDLILSISSVDTALFQELGIQTKIITLPVFIEEQNNKVDYSSSCFYHIGAMNWQPNIEAVEALISTIFPRIKEIIPDAELHLAGSYFPENIQTNEANGIYVHGFVADKFQFINAHGIQLVNLKSGSGVRIKLLESLAMGVPTVSTNMGIEGLDKSVKDAILISENDKEFIENAVLLHSNEELRRSMGEKSIDFAQKHHNYSTIKKTFIEALEYIS